MNITQKQYNKWLALAFVVTNTPEDSGSPFPEELLSDFLFKILEKKPDFELNDNYVFISLKNLFYNKIRNEKVKRKHFEKYSKDYLEVNSEVEDEFDYISDCRNTQEKLENLESGFYKLNTIEKRLYYLHYIVGHTQTYIAKEIGVPFKTVNQRMNRIKNKLKQYDKDIQQ